MSDDHDHGPLDLASLSASRRDFLKLAGFSIAAAMLPGCSRGAEHKAVPFLKKPEGVTPGQSQYFATTCYGCDAGCGLLVKVRDGRPIKIEGNDTHPLNMGRTCAVGQAGVLDLYDSYRLTEPFAQGKPSDWASVDAAIGAALGKVRQTPGAVRVLTGTISGPTALRALKQFGAQHVTMDSLMGSALPDAYEALYGTRIVPQYQFENAQALVAVDADFLGTWISPVEFARGYRAARSLDPQSTFCHHTHFESRVSLTGGNADRRVRVAPAELPLVLAALAERVAKGRGTSAPWGLAPECGVDRALLDATAKRLLEVDRGRALVVCGLNDATAQRITAYLNHLLGGDRGSPRATVDLKRDSRQTGGDEKALTQLRRDMDAGSVKALIIAGCNPVYELAEGAAFAASLKKVETVISVAQRMDETASVSNFVCPAPHYLASWSDAEPVRDLITISQPTIAPLGKTRQLVESLSTWSGVPATAYEQMRATWRDQLFARTTAGDTFDKWWHQSIHDGHADLQATKNDVPDFQSGAVGAAPAATAAGGLALVLYPKIGVRDGRHAHNPWLQELPDPVSKVSWQNTADLSPQTAAKLGLSDGDLVRVSAENETIELPVLVQDGQANDVVAIALGYGVLGTDRFVNAGPDWIQSTPTVEAGHTVGARAIALSGKGVVTVKATGETSDLARTQIYSRLEVPKHLAPKGGETRPFVQETTWDAYRLDPSSGKHAAHPEAELWADDHKYTGHHWELAIDLASCTGCAACVVACQSENNIPVVGKDEMTRQREMHWLRIDRYYQGDDDDLRIAHQPMMCQQCDHAPCETVCPVLATVHGEEGLNQQVYNRCVGTRYCSNNCPYKVRRFNWFDYAHDDSLQNLSLNPDVTIRSRGVMEKCTFCVQRIQEAKAVAAREGRRPLYRDEIQTACMQVCPVEAIVFGDSNDSASQLATQARSPRAFRVLEELNVQPSVSYLRRVKDRPAEEGTHND